MQYEKYERIKNRFKNKYWRNSIIFIVCGLIVLSFDNVLGVIMPIWGFIGFTHWMNKYLQDINHKEV